MLGTSPRGGSNCHRLSQLCHKQGLGWNSEFTVMPLSTLTRWQTGQNKKRESILETTQFDASQLCSRKLWQLVNDKESTPIQDAELQEAVNELTARRHYLAELARIGKLGDSNHHA